MTYRILVLVQASFIYSMNVFFHKIFCGDQSAIDLCSGAVFDLHESYTEVFFVVGCVYIVDTVIFAAIPLIQSRRESQRKSSSSFDDLKGGTRFETFRISAKRSISKSSLANGELQEAGGLNGGAGNTGGIATGTGSVVSPYGTIANSSREPAPVVAAGAEAYSNMARHSVHAD